MEDSNSTLDANLSGAIVYGLWLTSVVYLGLIIFVGFIGNFCCFVMFASVGYRSRSSSQYLLGLALADMGFLVTLTISWLENFDIYLIDNNGVYAALHYFSSFFSHVSSLYILTFTFERFVAVFRPLECRSLCTVYRARIIIVTVTLIAAMFNVWVPVDIMFKTRAEEIYNSSENDNFEAQFYSVMNAIDTGVTLFIPAFLIIVIDTLIAVKTLGKSKFRIQLMAGISEKASLTLIRKERRMTKTMLYIATAYILLNLPSYILRITSSLSLLDRFQLQFFELIAYLLFNTQYSINFVLYSVNSRCVLGQTGETPTILLSSVLEPILRMSVKRVPSRRQSSILINNNTQIDL